MLFTRTDFISRRTNSSTARILILPNSSCCFALNITQSKVFISGENFPLTSDVLYIDRCYNIFRVFSTCPPPLRTPKKQVPPIGQDELYMTPPSILPTPPRV